MGTFGTRPEDVVTDSRGNARSGVLMVLYPTKADAVAKTNPLGNATSDESGSWQIDVAGVDDAWVRTPDTPLRPGRVYAIVSDAPRRGPAGPVGPTGPVGPPVPVDALERMATLLDYKQNLTFAIASDSTSNDPGDWPTVWLYKMAQKYPALRVIRRPWNDTTQAYDSDVVLQAGTVSPDLGGVTMNDTFTRTSAELIGTASDSGAVWAGTTGVFRTDGDYLMLDQPKIGTASVNNQQKNGTVTAVMDIISAPNGVAQQVRWYLASDSVFAANHVFGFVSVSATGAVGFGLYKRVGGAVAFTQSLTPTQVTNAGIVSAAAAGVVQRVTVTLKVDIQNVTLTVTGPAGAAQAQTITHTMSETDYAQMGNYAGIGNAAAVSNSSIKTTSFKVDTPFLAGTAWTLTGVISSMGGGTLEYQRSRIATMYPSATPIDVMVISHGHNYSNQTAKQLTDVVAQFLTEYGAAHPESAYLISSQNAEQPPFANRGFHALRNAGLRAWAKSSRYAYLPAFEEFAKQADGGASYVLADGVHPTTTAAGTTTGAFGSVVWANVLDREVVARQWVK